MKDQILNELNDNSKLFTRFFQVGFALDSIERVVIILNSIKTNADRNFISRYIFTPSILKNHILQLSDGLYGQSPVFNSRMIDFYYKIPISLSTVTDDSIKQIVSIPLISAVSMFHLSHSPNCPPAHVCVENQDGVVTIPVSDYLTCEAVTSKLIPTICRMRPCITSSSAVCRMVNVSTAVISTEIRFMAKVECNDGSSTKLQNLHLLLFFSVMSDSDDSDEKVRRALTRIEEKRITQKALKHLLAKISKKKKSKSVSSDDDSFLEV